MAELTSRKRPSGVERKMPTGAFQTMERYFCSLSLSAASALSRSATSTLSSELARVRSAVRSATRPSLVELHQRRLGALPLDDLGLQGTVLGFDASLQAIQPELRIDARQHLLGLVWLGDEIDAADSKGLHLVDRFVGRAEEDHRHAGGTFVGLQAPADLVAVDARHVHVEQNQIGRFGVGDGQGGFAADHRVNAKTLLEQQTGQQTQTPAVVVDDQDAGRMFGRC